MLFTAVTRAESSDRIAFSCQSGHDAKAAANQRRRYDVWQATHDDVTSCSAAFTSRMESNVWETEALWRAIASRLAAWCILVPASCIGWGKYGAISAA